MPAVFACALAAGLLARSGGETAPSSTKFLTQALGEQRPGAPLTRRPAPGVRVRLNAAGFRVSRPNAELGLSLVGSGRGRWQRFAGGVSRPTVFGRESVIVKSTGTEQFLTVQRRQGEREWNWLLDVDGTEPRLQRDGSILYLRPGGVPLLRTPPVAILDAAGEDVTPKGLRWSLGKAGGRWQLGLRLDDSKLPLPYVIDPAADYPDPLYLSSTASTVNFSWKLVGTSPTGANTATNNTPAQNATGYVLFVPGFAYTTIAAPTSNPAGAGWALDTAGGTGFPAGNWVFTVKTDIPDATLVAGHAILNVGMWKGTVAAGTFTPTATIINPSTGGDDPANQNLRTGVNPVTTNVTISVPRFALASNERLFVEFRRKQVGGINTGTASRRRLTFEVNSGTAKIAHPTADDAAPTNSLSITAASGAHYSSGTLYYKGDAAGSFRFSNALSDSGSGPYGTTYPAIATTGWTHANETVTGAAPYVSSVYSWSASPSNPADQTLVGEDNAMQTVNSVVSFVSDTSVPTGMSASVTAGYFTSLSVPVTLANGTDTGSGVDASSGIVERDEASLDNGDGTCDAFPGSWSTVTLSGGNDTSVQSGKCYRYRYKISDNVGNQGTQAGTSGTAKVDTSAPSDPSLTFGSFTNAVASGSTVYYLPSAASGQFQVTANGSSDAQSGVAGHTFPAAASGWTVSGSGASRTYSHSGSPTDPSEPNNVFATNGASLNSNNVSFTVTPDATGPSVSAPTVTAGFYSSASVAVTLNGGTDGGSGVASGSSVVERDEAPLDNGDGSCDAFAGSWSTVTLSGGNDTTVQSGKCYRYREQLSDNLGNVGTSGASNTAKIDTTAPSDPSLSYGSFSNAALNGGVVWYRPGAATGQFEVTASSTDAQSGVASYSFPAAASGWTVSGSGASRTYSHSGSPTDPSEPNDVRATNGAGIGSANVSFTVSPDSTAPSVTAPSVTAGFYTTTSVAVGLNGGSDSESGLAAGSSVVERDEAPLDNGDGSCDAFPGSWSTVTLSGGSDTTVQAGKCYRYRELLTDRVGNQGASAPSSTAKVDTSAPGDPSLSYGSFSNAALNGAVVWYRPGAAGGQFEVTASSTDAQSGVASYSFPAAASGWTVSGSGASRTYSHSGSPTDPSEPNDVRATNGAGINSGAVSFTVSPDGVAPSVTPPTVTAGFYTSTSVPVALNGGSDADSGIAAASSVVERDEAPLDNGDGTCDPFSGSWSTATLSGGSDTTVQTGKCYRYRELLSDRVGNQGASAPSSTVKVDTSAPADPSVSFSGFSSSALSGGVVWFRPGAAGGFRVSAVSSDGQSGVGGYSFPALGSGWSGSQNGGDYDYSFTTTAANPSEPNNVRATNGAGVNSGDVSFTVSPDSVAPSVTAPTVTAGFYASTSVAVTLNGGSDADSGVAAGSSVVERDEAPLDNGDGSCDAFPGSWSTVTLSGGNDTTVQTGKCYRYRELLSDRVGNQDASGASNTAKVDTTAPALPGLAYGSFADAAATGDTVYYRPSAANGQFQVTASSTDAQSGVASYAFPAPSAGWSVSGSGASRTYTHSGSPSDPGDPNDVTAANSAGISSAAASFTVTPDASAPSAISATVAGGYYTSLSIAVTLDNGTDTGSGVDATSGIVERDEAPLDNGDGSCDAFPGAWSTVTLSGGNDTSVQSGKCYRYRYKLSDRVGNPATSGPSATAKVDTSAPGVPTLTFGSLQAAFVSGTTVYYRLSAATGQFAVTASAADGQSGVVSYNFPAAASGWSVSGSGDTRTYSHSGSPSDPAEPNDLTAVNGAGTASGAASYTVTPDASTPSSSILCDGAACTSWYQSTVSVTLSATDTGSGLDQIRYTTDGSDPTATTGTVYTGAFDISATTEIRYRGFDRVGNSEAVRSQTIGFDTSGPTGPGLSVSESPADPDQHVVGTTLYYRSGGGRAGSFTVDAATSDPQSGIQKVTFPAVAGMTGGGDDLAGPYQGLYDWSGAVSASGAQTVTARNNAAITSSAAFTVTPDSTPPSGQSIAINGGPYYTALSVPLTVGNGTDDDSGVDASSALVEREVATLSDGNCVGWSGTWTAVTLTGGADTTVLSNRCYRYRHTISDNVGNQSAPSGASAVAKVDATLPVTSDDAPAGWRNSAVTVTLAVNETGSGVASTQFRVDGGAFQSGTSVVIPAPGDHSNDGVHTVDYRSTDNAGNTESLRSATVRIDTTLPTTTDDAPGGWRKTPVTVTLTPADALSGIASTEYRVDGGAFQNGVSVVVPAPADHSNDGIHTIEYRSTDNAANTEPLRTATVRIDTTLPTGSISSPSEGQHVNGVVPVSAAAADTGSGVGSVEFLVRPNGASSFTTISTDTSAPYQASWNSSGAAEGNAELKVVVLDAAGNALTSAIRNAVVDNPPAPALDDPGANVASLISLTASSADDTSQVVFERSPEGASTWTPIATDLTPPFAASFDTTSVSDARYDFRAVATDVGGFSGTSALRTSRVDNTRPSVSLSDPPSGALVGGPNVHLGALASDLGSGVASVRFEARPAGVGAFAGVGTDTSHPFDATWNTTSLSGAYELRAVATDSAGNAETSVTTLVTVDSTASSVTLAETGTLVRGVLTLAASTQGAAVTKVVFKKKPSSGDSWSDLETDVSAPWNTSFDTRQVADGLYDLRAQGLDYTGAVLATHTRENIRVDNTAPALVSSTPSEGASVDAVTAVVIVASEPVAAVHTATLDTNVVAPEIAGTQIRFATGTLGAGEHTLSGTLEDAAGNSSAFRVRFAVRGAPAPAALAMQLGKAGSAKRGRNQVFSVAVTLSTPARVQVTLLSPRGRRLRTTSKQLPAGRRVVSLSVPRSSLPPGRYTILVTATTPDGTQVLKRAQVTIKKASRKAKPKPKRNSVSPRQVTPSASPVPDSGDSGTPPPPAVTPTPDINRGGSVPSRRTPVAVPSVSPKPLATATSFVGETKRKTFGLGLIITSIGGAIGFLIKIELHRLLGRPRRFG